MREIESLKRRAWTKRFILIITVRQFFFTYKTLNYASDLFNSLQLLVSQK